MIKLHFLIDKHRNSSMDWLCKRNIHNKVPRDSPFYFGTESHYVFLGSLEILSQMSLPEIHRNLPATASKLLKLKCVLPCLKMLVIYVQKSVE